MILSKITLVQRRKGIIEFYKCSIIGRRNIDRIRAVRMGIGHKGFIILHFFVWYGSHQEPQSEEPQGTAQKS